MCECVADARWHARGSNAGEKREDVLSTETHNGPCDLLFLPCICMHSCAFIHPPSHPLVGFHLFSFSLPFTPSDARTRPCQVMCHVSLSLSRTIDGTWASAPSRAIAVLDLNSRALAALSPGAYLDTFRSESIAVGTEAVGTGASRLAFAG